MLPDRCESNISQSHENAFGSNQVLTVWYVWLLKCLPWSFVYVLVQGGFSCAGNLTGSLHCTQTLNWHKSIGLEH